MAASNYGPVRNLDHLGAARPRRLSMREAIEARAKQAQALVTARAECECAATRERERAEAERAAELAAELRAERELARFQRQLDAEARQDDRRVARILREFTRELDRQAKRERNAARRKARRERARRHREYLAREARRAAARRKRYSLVWRGSQPPAWAGTPATQPSARSRDLTPQPAPKPDTLTATVAEYIAASERACAALLPLLDACEPELETRRFDPEDYTNPDRGAYSGSALEVRHMDRDDLDLYDETQRDELAWVYLGHNAVVRPTHASVAAQALGACPPELEARTDWAALEATCNVRIPEGAAPGSLTPERARELMRVGSAPAQPAKPELRF
jgi:hypothetical protein